MLFGALDGVNALFGRDEQGYLAEPFPLVRVDYGLKIAARAAGKDRYLFHLSETPLPLTVLPMRYAFSPDASSAAIVFSASALSTQTTMPMPMLKVL